MARKNAGKWIGGAAGLIAVSVVGYILYKKFAQAPRSLDQPLTAPQASVGATRAAASPIQHVSKGEKLATASHEIINTKQPGMKYGKVTGSSQDQAGRVVRQFTAPADGFFTGRILQLKNNFYGEVRPG